MRWDDMAVVGRVARTHGLRGQVIINPETDFPESRFEPGSTIYRAGHDGSVDALRVASLRMQRGRPIVAFEGIGSIDEAEALAGIELRVPMTALEPLAAGSFYLHDLVGCRVATRSGDAIGSVERVEGEGTVSRLAISTEQGEVLVPLAADICVRIDIAEKAIVIDPPEGLLDLNRPSGRRGSQRVSRAGVARQKPRR